MTIRTFLISLCLTVPSPATNKQESTQDFDAFWRLGKDGNIVLVIRNTSESDLLICVPYDLRIPGVITYRDKNKPPDEHKVGTLQGGEGRTIFIPLLSRGKNESAHDADVWVGKMEFLARDASKITEVKCFITYIRLSDIRNANTFGDLSKLARTWKGVVREDNETKIRPW